MRLIKILAFTLIGLAIVLIGGAYLAIQFVDMQRIKDLVQAQVQAETGRAFTIAGAVEPSLGLMPTVALGDVRLANPEWAETPHLIEAEQLEVSLALWPLFRGAVEVAGVQVAGATINLEERGKQVSWVFDAPAKNNQSQPANGAQPAPQAGQSAEAFALDQLVLRDSVLGYYRHGAAQRHRVQISQLRLRGLNGRWVETLSAQARYEGARIELSATGAQADMVQVDASVSKAETRVSASGNVALADFTYDLRVQAETAALRDALAIAGVASDDATQVRLDAKIGGNPRIVTFSELDLYYGAHAINGSGELSLNSAIPYLEASLSAEQITIASPEPPLEEVTNMPAEAPKADSVASPIPDTPLPAEALHALNADVTITIGELQTPHINLSEAKASLALQDGRLRIDPLAVATSQGWVRGSAGLDAQTTPPTLHLDLLTNDIALSALLMELAGESAIEGGIVKSDLKLQGQGVTLREAVADARGHFNFYFDEAVYRTPATLQETQSFVNILRGAEDPPNEVHIACGVGRFTIAKGIAESDLLAMKTTGAVVTGDGAFILPTASLNMVLTARSGFLGVADAVPSLKIKGPIANPVVRLDTGSAIVGIGKLVLGATTGVGLAVVLGEQVTDRLGITAETNPCLKDIAQMEAKAPKTPEEKAKQAEETVKENAKQVEENVKQKRDEIKEGIKQLEDETEVIRDNLREIFKKKE